MNLLVTGGAGFIGSNFIRYMLAEHPHIAIVNLDALTYAGNRQNLNDVDTDPRYRFVRGDICDPTLVSGVMEEQGIDTVVHFAAESHVDRSIADAAACVRTNLLGTHTLLEAARKQEVEKFIHISTDEVYGSRQEGSFTETDLLTPSSPYSSSKAGSDLLALACHTTYSLPVIVTRCTNNFGPFQYPEKLIPLFVTNLIDGRKVPVYGTGKNVRDWIHVLDHCSAVDLLTRKGKAGEIYNIGGGNERTNLEITETILRLLGKDGSWIEHVRDRPGHDLRYSLDCTKIRRLGWKPAGSFEDGLRDTVRWYQENEWWWRPLKP